MLQGGMEAFRLGTQHYYKWPRMALVQDRASKYSLFSTSNTGAQRLCRQDASKRGSGENQISPISIQAVQRPQEKLDRETDHSRLVKSQRIHSMRFIQDAYSVASTSGSPQGSLDVLNRSQRRVLAHTYSQSLSSLPRVQVGPTTVSIQSHAVWTQYSSTDFHQDIQRNLGPSQNPRHPGSSLSGRLASMGDVSRGLFTSARYSHEGAQRSWLYSQLGKVQTYTSSDFYLAGNQMESSQGVVRSSYSNPIDRQVGADQISQKEIKFEKTLGKDPGTSSLRLGDQSSLESKTKRPKLDLAPVCTSGFAGHSSSYPGVMQGDTSPLGEEVSTSFHHPDSSSSNFKGVPHRCLPSRLGRPLGGEEGSWTLETSSKHLPYKHFGIDGGFSDIEASETIPGIPHQSGYGQLDGSRLFKEGGISITSSEPCDPGDSSIPLEVQRHVNGSPSGGVSECPGRCSLSPDSHGLGMVIRSNLVPPDTSSCTGSPSRSFCNIGESQTFELCGSEHGPKCSCKGCIRSRLESLASNLFVSTDESDFEGFETINPIQREVRPSDTNVAEQHLVPPATKHAPYTNTSPPGEAISAGWKGDSLRFLLSEPVPSRMGFLTFIYERQYSTKNVEYLIASRRKSSLRQFESTWQSWISFVKSQNPSRIDEEILLSYFVHLFEERKLAASTILSYKSSLREPILKGFGIDLNSDTFATLTKSFGLARPAKSNPIVSWSLENVLDHLSNSPNESLEPKMLLQKTIFLLTLAMGARVSEIAALRRGDKFLKISECGNLFLTPGPDFLAKNENPFRRRDPISIAPLSSRSEMCPVFTLRYYLDKTKDITDGPLFRHSISNKPLTIMGIKILLTSLIKKCNPDSIPKSHDIRKMATSLAFFNYRTSETFSCLQDGQENTYFL